MSLPRTLRSPLLLIAALSFAPAGCADGIIGVDDDDDVPGDDDDAAETPLFDQASGTVEYAMSYNDGALEGEECVETYGLSSVDATEQATTELARLQEACPGCGALFQGFFNDIDVECAGGPDLPEDNFLSFDLTVEGVATMWWKADGDWIELGSGTIDFDEVVIEVEDPDTGGWGGWGGNSTNDDPCAGFGNRCRWDGLYINHLDLGSTDRPEE